MSKGDIETRERDRQLELKATFLLFTRKGGGIGGRHAAQEIRAKEPEPLTDGTIGNRTASMQLDAHTGRGSRQGSHRTHLGTWR